MFRSPFIRKKIILRAKAREFFDKFCFALECFGNPTSFSDIYTRLIAQTEEGPGQIKIEMDKDDGYLSISISKLTWDYEGRYKEAFLKGRFYKVHIRPFELSKWDPKDLARKLHELSAEYAQVDEEIDKIAQEARAKKDKIDKSAKERKAKIDAMAREQIAKM